MSNRRTTVLTVSLLILAAVLLVTHRVQADSSATRLTSALLAPDSSEVGYQGVLTNNSGEPVADADYSVTFTLYDAASDGNDLWTETQTVSTTNGLFNVYLGAITALPSNVIDGRDLWLGITVDGDAEMAPRIPIVSVPYARSLVPGAYIQARLNNTALLSINNDTFGNNGVGLRVESRRDNSIEAEGDVQVQRGDLEVIQGNVEAGANVVAGGNVQAGNNVAADDNVQAGNDVEANRDVLAGRHVEANGNVNANGGNLFGQNVLTNGSVFANADVDADRDVLAGRNVVADDDVRATGNLVGQNLNVNGFVTAGVDITADRHIEADDNMIAGGNITAGGNIQAAGDIAAAGVKNAVIETARFGRRLTYAIEGAGVWLVDQGQGQLHKGAATIELDPIFLETVTVDDARPMLVHLTLTSDSKGVYVAEQTATSFTVRELQGGTSAATFNWQVSALRRGYENTRLELYSEIERAGDVD